MAIRNYKAVQNFRLDDQDVTAGDEMILPDKIGEHLVEEGKLVGGRFLDRNDGDDKKKIADAEAKHSDRYEAAKVKEEARDDAKDNDLRKDDQKREKLLSEVKDLKPEALQKAEALDTAALEKFVQEIKDGIDQDMEEEEEEAADGDADEEDEAEEEAEGPGKGEPAGPKKPAKK